MLMTSGRRADTRFALELALQQLLGGGQLADVMTTVCDTFSWKPLNSRVAFTWQASDGSEQRVTTGGLPESLAGAGASPDSPWAVARATMRGVEELTLDKLPSNLRALAEQHNLGAYWVEPVRAGTVPALITVWTARGGRPPAIHVQGMMLARSIVEIIMRWTDQQARLDFAAFHDELTSLPNRKAFFRALERSVPGAILYCDLDRFKPVNDSFGHAAGDELLRQVARRLQATVRSDDLVARLGGDEFVILCPASTAADAEQLADRIRAAIAEPFSIHSADVSIGISVGIAHTNDRLDDSSVAAADRALYSAKALRRAARD
jgi:diguanylate cyclase (GGDEF)-like protein